MRDRLVNGHTRWRRVLPRRRRGWLWVALGVGNVLNGLRLRRRLSGLARLESAGPGQSPSHEDFLVVSSPGASVDGSTLRAAIAYAQTENLDVLDLVPGNLPLDQALDLARGVDTTTFRSDPLAPGRGALHALVVRRAVWARMQPAPGEPGEVRDRAALVRLTERLKHHAARSTDLAVAPDLFAVDSSVPERLGQLKELYGAAFPLALTIATARSVLLMAGVVLCPGWGAVALATFIGQPYLVTAGSALHPRRRSQLGDAIGLIVEPFGLLRAAQAEKAMGDADVGEARDNDPIESRRALYEGILARGTEQFFEPRRAICPWCESTALAERLRTTDLFQIKPGEFVLSECQSCGVVFQNPRLSADGLDFYYRDFYDGLGARRLQFLFGQSQPAYWDRVALARRHLSPLSWLDVGTGYGHFCLIARGLLPETRFDGLDMGESVEEAQRRGWIDHGYRGPFPDMARELNGRYDLVSMHHYLEHTTDPAAELDAAHAVLEPGGCVLIEVPDPECRFGRLLGRYWIPWLQPQHLQFLPAANLCTALEDRGFSVLEIDHNPSHPAFEVAGAIWTLSAALAPPARSPWRSEPGAAERLERWITLTAMVPVGLVGVALGSALHPLIGNKAEPWSNAYRVLAQRL